MTSSAKLNNPRSLINPPEGGGGRGGGGGGTQQSFK